MAEPWFGLSRPDQTEALEVAVARAGRQAHLLEKDILGGVGSLHDLWF